jgi:Family of unknown function (DUF5694)
MMRQAITAVALMIGLIAGSAMAQTAAKRGPAPEPVQVMVLGTYHFGNPGLDINNMKADSVLTPQRQRELERVADALAKFRPTHVMVEMQSREPDLAIGEYRRFDAKMLASDANEIVQIGYRTAQRAGLTAVQGIDEQPGDGEPDYFPYDKLEATAGRLGKTPLLQSLNADTTAWLKDFEAAQKTSSVGQLLLRMNDPGGLQGGMDYYYSALAIGDRDDQAGADLNAMWYLRNAKIFSKLMLIAKPGAKAPARVLVVYGGGHLFWLKHFARHTPGYVDVDVTPYLRRAR